jgi:hypothetical protein
MKTLKAIGAGAILALALTVPTYAGQLETPGYTVPPPPPPPELNFSVDTVGVSAPTEMSSAPSNIGTPGFADLLWVLASIF